MMKFSLTAPLIAAFTLVSSSSSTVEGKISRKSNKHSVEKKVSETFVKPNVNADALAEAYEEMGRWIEPTTNNKANEGGNLFITLITAMLTLSFSSSTFNIQHSTFNNLGLDIT